MKANILRVKWSGKKEWRYDGGVGSLSTRTEGPHTVDRGGKQHWGEADVAQVQEMDSARDYMMKLFENGIAGI